jgi:uncharacterized protein with PQ loop repeat
VKKKALLSLLTISMSIISSLGNLAPYLQAFEMFQLKSAHAISLYATVISLVVGICWLSFGIITKVKPLIISNMLGLPGVVLILIQICYYKY